MKKATLLSRMKERMGKPTTTQASGEAVTLKHRSGYEAGTSLKVAKKAQMADGMDIDELIVMHNKKMDWTLILYLHWTMRSFEWLFCKIGGPRWDEKKVGVSTVFGWDQESEEYTMSLAITEKHNRWDMKKMAVMALE